MTEFERKANLSQEKKEKTAQADALSKALTMCRSVRSYDFCIAYLLSEERELRCEVEEMTE